jgi:hypothetical protein
VNEKNRIELKSLPFDLLFEESCSAKAGFVVLPLRDYEFFYCV